MRERNLFVNYKYGMRWKDIQLTEMPVGNFDVVGVHDQGSFLHRQDRAILGSDKATTKIKRLLSRVPQVIDLVFLDSGFRAANPIDQNEHWQQNAGPRDYAYMRENVPGFPERSDPNAIMLVLTSNEGANRVQLSGWIIAHRMGHALTFGSDFENYFENIMYAINDIQQYWRDGWMAPSIEVMYMIGKMKSCRDRNLTQTAEMVYECFAQYIIQGRVSFNPATHDSVERMLASAKSDWGYVPKVEDRDIEQFNEMLESNARTINSTCQRILDAAQGLAVVL